MKEAKIIMGPNCSFEAIFLTHLACFIQKLVDSQRAHSSASNSPITQVRQFVDLQVNTVCRVQVLTRRLLA